jgi:hypothetical protein
MVVSMSKTNIYKRKLLYNTLYLQKRTSTIRRRNVGFVFDKRPSYADGVAVQVNAGTPTDKL